MPDVYDWQKQGAFIYDWETQSGEERAELMRASTVNRLKGTVLNLAAVVSAIDVDVALLKADHANTTPSKLLLVQLAAAGITAWAARDYHNQAHQQHTEAYELL